ncbi:ABC transporter permease [Psychromonas ossibalaenae]|uniref:ABC transporter permease n=1 Tax=Psychromonas ossibalaenae TaxID=444922 RepID=UPI00036148BA|nr:ABC transporter permease [Psychromonas ossibalaenae]
MLVKLAWRNLWRQKRRTILTASALALALILSLVMRCIQEGSYSANIENIARLSTGLIQLQHPEFKDSQSIDDLLSADPEFIDFARELSTVETILPRIESFALAASGDKSKGILVFGIDPLPEDIYSSLSKKVISGSYFSERQNKGDKPQVLIAEGLARQLGLQPGDELVLYGQGYRGQTAAGLFTIQGILHFPMPQLNNQLVYMSLQSAQYLYSTGDLVTSWVLHTDSLADVEQAASALKQYYQQGVNVRDWLDLSPDLAQQILMDRTSGLILMYLLYGIVGFGLFATLLMMTLERQREFAVMLATGLLRSKLLKLICIESAFIGLLGIIIGLLIAFPILIWLLFNPITLTGETAQLMLEMGYDPIIPVLLDPQLFINQIVVVLGLLVLCLIYPLLRLYKIDLVSALKGGAHAA